MVAWTRLFAHNTTRKRTGCGHEQRREILVGLKSALYISKADNGLLLDFNREQRGFSGNQFSACNHIPTTVVRTRCYPHFQTISAKQFSYNLLKAMPRDLTELDFFFDDSFQDVWNSICENDPLRCLRTRRPYAGEEYGMWIVVGNSPCLFSDAQVLG